MKKNKLTNRIKKAFLATGLGSTVILAPTAILANQQHNLAVVKKQAESLEQSSTYNLLGNEYTNKQNVIADIYNWNDKDINTNTNFNLKYMFFAQEEKKYFKVWVWDKVWSKYQPDSWTGVAIDRRKIGNTNKLVNYQFDFSNALAPKVNYCLDGDFYSNFTVESHIDNKFKSPNNQWISNSIFNLNNLPLNTRSQSKDISFYNYTAPTQPYDKNKLFWINTTTWTNFHNGVFNKEYGRYTREYLVLQDFSSTGDRTANAIKISSPFFLNFITTKPVVYSNNGKTWNGDTITSGIIPNSECFTFSDNFYLLNTLNQANAIYNSANKLFTEFSNDSSSIVKEGWDPTFALANLDLILKTINKNGYTDINQLNQLWSDIYINKGSKSAPILDADKETISTLVDRFSPRFRTLTGYDLKHDTANVLYQPLLSMFKDNAVYATFKVNGKLIEDTDSLTNQRSPRKVLIWDNQKDCFNKFWINQLCKEINDTNIVKIELQDISIENTSVKNNDKLTNKPIFYDKNYFANLKDIATNCDLKTKGSFNIQYRINAINFTGINTAKWVRKEDFTTLPIETKTTCSQLIYNQNDFSGDIKHYVNDLKSDKINAKKILLDALNDTIFPTTEKNYKDTPEHFRMFSNVISSIGVGDLSRPMTTLDGLSVQPLPQTILDKDTSKNFFTDKSWTDAFAAFGIRLYKDQFPVYSALKTGDLYIIATIDNWVFPSSNGYLNGDYDNHWKDLFFSRKFLLNDNGEPQLTQFVRELEPKNRYYGDKFDKNGYFLIKVQPFINKTNSTFNGDLKISDKNKEFVYNSLCAIEDTMKTPEVWNNDKVFVDNSTFFQTNDWYEKNISINIEVFKSVLIKNVGKYFPDITKNDIVLWINNFVSEKMALALQKGEDYDLQEEILKNLFNLNYVPVRFEVEDSYTSGLNFIEPIDLKNNVLLKEVMKNNHLTFEEVFKNKHEKLVRIYDPFDNHNGIYIPNNVVYVFDDFAKTQWEKNNAMVIFDNSPELNGLNKVYTKDKTYLEVLLPIDTLLDWNDKGYIDLTFNGTDDIVKKIYQIRGVWDNINFQMYGRNKPELQALTKKHYDERKQSKTGNVLLVSLAPVLVLVIIAVIGMTISVIKRSKI